MAVAAETVVRARISTRPYFYFWMAVLAAATAFIGFAPTFWLPMTQGAYVASPVLAIHGLLFSGWTLFFVLQTWFVASGHTANHRASGLLGIALASVMTVFGIMAVINLVHRAAGVGALNAGLSFAVLPLWHIVFFAVMVTLAITNVRRPEWHKRLMLMASISLLDAPVARLFIYFMGFHGHMPVPAGLPSPPPPLTGITPWEIVVDMYLLLPIIYDWRTRGRPHPVYLFGGAAFVLLELLEAPISTTVAWHGIASWLVSLGG
jgi:hypothetical protein